MRAIVGEHGRFVARTLRRAGVPRAELDDQIQRTFIVLDERLKDLHPGAERSFLFQVAQNVASHSRRALSRRRDFPSDRIPERIEELLTPEHLVTRKQTHAEIDRILARLREPLRSVFVLYELEEMELSQIARVLRIPRGTAASRLRRARAHLREDPAAIELAWNSGVKGAPREEPPLLRSEELTALERALLDAGMRTPGSGAIGARRWLSGVRTF